LAGIFILSLPAKLLIAAHLSPKLSSICVCGTLLIVKWYEKWSQRTHFCLVQKRAAPAAHPGIVQNLLEAQHIYILNITIVENVKVTSVTSKEIVDLTIIPM
jgi:hypothetical protein